MTKRTPQQPHRTTTKPRGVLVYNGTRVWRFPKATGWGIEGGCIGVGMPTGHYTADNRQINETVATFHTWDRVCWMDDPLG